MFRKKAMRAVALLLLSTMFISSVGNGAYIEAMSNLSTSISENNSEKSISEKDIDLEKLKEDGRRYLDRVAISNSDRHSLKSGAGSFFKWLGGLCAKGILGYAVKWGASELLSLMFSSEPDSDTKILEKMDLIISDISCLKNQLGQIEDSIVNLTNINQLNEFLTKSWSTEGSMRTIYGGNARA